MKNNECCNSWRKGTDGTVLFFSSIMRHVDIFVVLKSEKASCSLSFLLEIAKLAYDHVYHVLFLYAGAIHNNIHNLRDL